MLGWTPKRLPTRLAATLVLAACVGIAVPHTSAARHGADGGFSEVRLPGNCDTIRRVEALFVCVDAQSGVVEFIHPGSGAPSITKIRLGALSHPSDAVAVGADVWVGEFATCKLTRIDASGRIVARYAVTPGHGPFALTLGPDGNIWFVANAGTIGRFSASGGLREYHVQTPGVQLGGIVGGPDHNLWFTESYGNKIGRITPGGVITEHRLPTRLSFPTQIVVGPDKALWFTEEGSGKVGRLTTSGKLSEFELSNVTSHPSAITSVGGALWFVTTRGNTIGRITTSGKISEWKIPTSAGPTGIAAGPHGSLWFTHSKAKKLGIFTPHNIPIVEGPQGEKCADFTPTDISRKTFEVGVYNDVRLTIANVGTCGAFGRVWSKGNRLIDAARVKLVYDHPEWVHHVFPPPRVWIEAGRSATFDIRFEPHEIGRYELHACAVATQAPDTNYKNSCTTRDFDTGKTGTIAPAQSGGEATRKYIPPSDCRPDFLPEAINVRSFTYREANLVRVTIENAGDCGGSGHFWSSSNEVSDPAVVKLVGYQNAMWWPHQVNDISLGPGDTATVDYSVQPLERGYHRLHACATADEPEDADAGNMCITREVPTGYSETVPPEQARLAPTVTPPPGRCKADFTVTGIFTSVLHAGTESTVRVQAQNIGTCDAWGTISLIPVHPEGAAPTSTPAESPQLFIPKDESGTFDFKVTPADNNILEFHGCADAIDPADAVNSNRCSTRTIAMGEAGGYVAPRIPRPTR